MGKSAAEQWLLQHGVATIDADRLAREIVEPHSPALREIQQAFGSRIVGPDGALRREELAGIVFSDPGARQKLESITHPRIRDKWMQQLQAWRTQGCSRAVVVIPLLFETGAENDLDATICVACSAATQRQRLLDRGWTDEEIRRRTAAQWPVERKMVKADFVVWTEGSLDLLAEQLARVFQVAPRA